MKNILHISDLHLSTDKKKGFHIDNVSEMLSDLLSDVDTLSNERKIKIDTVFFTGDLVFSGKEEEYIELEKVFLSKIKESLSLNDEDIFLVPGNHDCSRERISRAENMFRGSASSEEKSLMFDDIENGREEWSRLLDYKGISEKYSKNKLSGNVLFEVYEISRNLFVICANTAWLAQDENDYGELFFSEKQLNLIMRKIPKSAKKILLTHHPIEWVSEREIDFVTNFIEKNIEIHCYGHMHDFKQKSVSSFEEDITISLQAGTLDTRSKYAGYSVICFNNKNDISDGRVIYRKYEEGDGFSPWGEVCEDGECGFSTESISKFDQRKFSLLSGDKLKILDQSLIFNIGSEKDKIKRISDMYIEPNFEKPAFYGVCSLNNKDILSSSDLCGIDNAVLIFGGENSGKSFLIKYMYSEALKKQADGDCSEFSFYIDFSNFEFKNKHSVVIESCLQYSSNDMSTSFEEKVKSMISKGYASFYIDNVSCVNIDKFQRFLDFVENNSGCRFFITADAIEGPSLSSRFNSVFDKPIDLVSLGQLKRKNVREIVKRWVPTLPIDCEFSAYNEVTKVINNSLLPHNYFVYTVLLSIYESEKINKDILSEADVLENFIEILLNKTDMNFGEGRPPYKVILHFMGFVSSNIFYEKRAEFSYNEIFEFAIKFDSLTMYGFNAKDYVDPVVKCGILNAKNGSLYFSQSSFYHFFLSYFMAHDNDLKNVILDGDNYIINDKVVEYYASRNVSDLSLLDFMSEKVEETISNIELEILNDKAISVKELDFENVGDISILDVASSIDDVEGKILEIESDREKDDERLDSISPLKSHKDSFEKNAELYEEPQVRLREQLSLYSRVFRNTDLVLRPEAVSEIFENILQGYIFLTKLSIVQLDEQFIMPLIRPLIEDHIKEEGYSEYELESFMEDLRTVLSIARAAMPNHYQNIMSYDLSSRNKRVRTIIQKAERSLDGNVELTLLSYLLMDLDDSIITKEASKVAKYNTAFSNSTLFFKIIQVLSSNYSIKKDVKDKLKSQANSLVKKNRLDLSSKLKQFNKVMGISS